MTHIGIGDWVTKQQRKKWKWAQHVASDTSNKWTIAAASWDPTTNIQHKTKRRQARPKTRWIDDIERHVCEHYTTPHDWTNLAKDEKGWNDLEEAFVGRNE